MALVAAEVGVSQQKHNSHWSHRLSDESFARFPPLHSLGLDLGIQTDKPQDGPCLRSGTLYHPLRERGWDRDFTRPGEAALEDQKRMLGLA